MVSYIVINNGSNTEQYRLTNECNKPYMNVGNAKLPMIEATTTTTGLYVGGGIIED